nr:MAG TPA: hypothetical protein [Caudoviricetes sp.]
MYSTKFRRIQTYRILLSLPAMLIILGAST